MRHRGVGICALLACSAWLALSGSNENSAAELPAPTAPPSAILAPPPAVVPPGASLQVVQVPPPAPQQPSTPEQTPTPPAPPVVQPTQPTTPEATTPTTTPTSVLAGVNLLSGISGAAAPQASPSSTTQPNTVIANPAAVSVAGADQAVVRASTDVGDMIVKAQAAGVQVQRRSPIITDPRVRGYWGGQLAVLANGAPFSPARYDLDTVVSKIDSSNLENVVVVMGPYSVRYGPGFAFLDIETLSTPRYKCFEAHEDSSLVYNTNGEQWRGRQSAWAGESNWGVRIGWDIMEGSDYFTGAGLRMPSRYSQQDLDFAFGFDFNADTHLEFRGLRLRGRNIEIPGALTDINALVTDAYTLRFTMENQVLFDRMNVDAWYNSTHFNGDNLRPSKFLQIPELGDFLNNLPSTKLILTTQGDSISRGFREAMTWGKAKEAQFTVGVDFQYLSSYLDEFDTFTGPLLPQPISFNSPIPRAHLADPGIFADYVLPASDNLILKAGARIDFATTQVQTPLKPPPEPNPNNIPPSSFFYEGDLGPNALSLRHFYLWSLYGTADYKVNEHWKLLGGVGYAEIPPTLTNLYADTPFLALYQNGFNFFVGNPSLSPPQALQMDFGFKGDYERFRTGFSYYYSWIHNYITSELFDPNSQLLQLEKGTQVKLRGYRFMNTELATLTGGEYYCEWDALDWLTPYGVLSDTIGTDQTRNGLDDTFTRYSLSRFPNGLRGGVYNAQEPLPGISPIEARVGFRIHEQNKNPRWAIEFYTRIVGNQDRFAASLDELPTPGFTIYNIRGYWQVNKHFLLTAGVENFTNHNYRESVDLLTGRGVFQPGINFYFGSKLEF
jgi:outer membrane receptor protein involved in Fe transport